MALFYKNRIFLKEIGLTVYTTVYQEVGDYENVEPGESTGYLYNRYNYLLKGSFKIDLPEEQDVIVDEISTVWPLKDLSNIGKFTSTSLEPETMCYCVVPLNKRVLSYTEHDLVADVTFTTPSGVLCITTVPCLINDAENPAHSLVAVVNTPAVIVPEKNGKLYCFKSSIS